MKTFIFCCLITFAFCLFVSPANAQSNVGCVQVTKLLVAVDPPLTSTGPVLGVIEISFASNGNSRKAIEVIVNGVAHSFIPTGSGTLVSDLILQRGTTFSVTVNTYSTSDPEKGKMCSSETRVIVIPG